MEKSEVIEIYDRILRGQTLYLLSGTTQRIRAHAEEVGGNFYLEYHVCESIGNDTYKCYLLLPKSFL